MRTKLHGISAPYLTKPVWRQQPLYIPQSSFTAIKILVVPLFVSSDFSHILAPPPTIPTQRQHHYKPLHASFPTHLFHALKCTLCKSAQFSM